MLDSDGFQTLGTQPFLNDYKKSSYPKLNRFGETEIIPNRIYIPS